MENYEFIRIKLDVSPETNQKIMELSNNWPHQTKRFEVERGQPRRDFWMHHESLVASDNLKEEVMRSMGMVDPRLRMHRGWIQNYHVGQSCKRHTHTGEYSPRDVTVSGVYYVNGGGSLRLHNTSKGEIEIETFTGEIVFFSAGVLHSSSPNPGPGRRVCVATNFSPEVYNPCLL